MTSISKPKEVNIKDLLKEYQSSSIIEKLVNKLDVRTDRKFRLINNQGSITSLLIGLMCEKRPGVRVVVLNDREEAAYFYNDIISFKDEADVAFLPSSYRRLIKEEDRDNDSVLVRTEVLTKLLSGKIDTLVTFPEALAELVVGVDVMEKSSLIVKQGEELSISFLEDVFVEYGFERNDFVFEPGQYSIRGSLVDVYSYAEEQPVRIDFFGNTIDSIRFFDVESQLSDMKIEEFALVPDFNTSSIIEKANYTSIFSYFQETPVWWIKDGMTIYDRIKSLSKDDVDGILVDFDELFAKLDKSIVVEWGMDLYFRGKDIDVSAELQVPTNKQFDVLGELLSTYQNSGYKIFICSTNEKQIDRVGDIFKEKSYNIAFTWLDGIIHEGFIDHREKLCVLTEHQIFDRYHKYKLQTTRIRQSRESITLNELQNLHPGDYVVHIDHGIGRFGGLVKMDNNGHEQEAIRLVYKNNSELYVSLHSLHKISKYRGKEGTAPAVNKLGGDAWNKLKQKAKSKVKDIARELIALYAKRKREYAFAFSHDSYLQEEMEASFMYDETPDQMKAIDAVKSDMEKPQVMDRLVCGDVGFGKTEVAIRAAFKAVADSKQVAVLVPTTVLAYQHYNTFCKRLDGMPCRVEYVCRMRSTTEVKKVLKDLKDGLVDIVIGTHRLVSKDVVFKDLGLLVIDEEQKFGVGVKEKLKQIKLNVDTLTMTATPIPRTLQFSLMGARDMSIIRTPPANRYPIVTELHRFDDNIIKEAIAYEISRGGQMFFIHDRVASLIDIQLLLHRLVPRVKTCIAHGQMAGGELEKVMHDFVRGDYDVMIATTIIESGLDIPNANTIIINQAQNFGLSDLHQLRGRVGRSNKKAFCYLLTPSLELINADSRRRLKAIEDFSGLGSGFNIAMQDLDIRGAGNILGAEQSGFISEIGYETYQRILNEALLELHSEDGLDYERADVVNMVGYVADCSVETDFKALIPDSYVENISERVRLYRELDAMEKDEDLDKFSHELRDRFGEIPVEVLDLMSVVRIRRLCCTLGIERVLAKNGKLVMYFVSDAQSLFYSSPIFTNILLFTQHNSNDCRFSEKNGKLSLVFEKVGKVPVFEKKITAMSNFVMGNC